MVWGALFPTISDRLGKLLYSSTRQTERNTETIRKGGHTLRIERDQRLMDSISLSLSGVECSSPISSASGALDLSISLAFVPLLCSKSRESWSRISFQKFPFDKCIVKKKVSPDYLSFRYSFPWSSLVTEELRKIWIVRIAAWQFLREILHFIGKLVCQN